MLYLLSVLPGPVDVVAPGDDDGKLVIEHRAVFNIQRTVNNCGLLTVIHLKIKIRSATLNKNI